MTMTPGDDCKRLPDALTRSRLTGFETKFFYCQDVPRARMDFVDPSKTYMPLEEHSATVLDARPMRNDLDLEREGLVLLDHSSCITNLKNISSFADRYLGEMVELVRGLSGADVVLGYKNYMNWRISPAPAEVADPNQIPARWVHTDFTKEYYEGFVSTVWTAAGIEANSYSRMAVYQTWAPFTEPPEDFPFALVNGATVSPEDYVIMDNHSGGEEGFMLQTRLGKFSPSHQWLYFSDMLPSEIIIFKGNDTLHGDNQIILHSAFDARPFHARTVPRESVETRIFAFWH